MRKIWIAIGSFIGGIAAVIVLVLAWKKHLNTAHDLVMSNLPMDIGIATEEYNKRLQATLEKLQSERSDAIVEKFKKAFGG